MITKESLVQAKDSVNEALMILKQKYNNSPDNKYIYFIVEGKDDIPYYKTKANGYIDDEWNLVCINARNRKNVIKVYKEIDWTIYSKNRIAFFVDRDLSDYTGEETPTDDNVYITDAYSIENTLCTYDTFIQTMKFYYELEDADTSEEKALLDYYNDCWTQFELFAVPIMGKILLWKKNGVNGNYANFRIQSIFSIENMQLKLKNEYDDIDKVIEYLSKQSNVNYVDEDLSIYIDELKSIHNPYEFIRGKYVMAFFVCLINYAASNIDTILIKRKKIKNSLCLGYEDCIFKLCGIMKIPISLRSFYMAFNSRLIQN